MAVDEARVTELINQAFDHYKGDYTKETEKVVMNALTQYDERVNKQVLEAGREVLERTSTQAKELETKLREDLRGYCVTLQNQLNERLSTSEENVRKINEQAELLRVNIEREGQHGREHGRVSRWQRWIARETR